MTRDTAPSERLKQADKALKQRDMALLADLCAQEQAEDPKATWPDQLLAMAELQQGKPELALARMEALVKKHRTSSECWGLLGTLQMELKQLGPAEKSLRNAAAYASPDAASPFFNLGNLLRQKGNMNEAQQCYELALSRNPDHHGSKHCLALCLIYFKDLDKAEDIARACFDSAPDKAEAHFLLGNIAQHRGLMRQALEHFEKAIAINPRQGGYHNNLGNVFGAMGNSYQSMESFRRAIEYSPDNPKYMSNLLFSMQYVDKITPEAIFKAHRAWGNKFTPRPPALPRPPLSDDTPLVVGLVSADFGLHPVGHFVMPLLKGADPDRLRIILYSDRVNEDKHTARLMKEAYAFRRAIGATDSTLAHQIVQDGVHVLIDMSGHTSGNRLQMFGQRVAPLQATWAAYVGTTGVPAIDLLIADQKQVPLGDEDLYVEKVLRLPVGYVPYEPPPHMPDLRPCPDPADGIWFGSFNNPTKFSKTCLTLWAKTLKSITGSRLLIKFNHLEQQETQNDIRSRFASLGGDPNQLVIEGGSPHKEFLDRYNDVHMAFDTLPYTGGLTTLEAVYMGTPVLALPGRTFASRHSLTHLSHMGLEAFCAKDEKAFIAMAQKLAADHEALLTYKATLRQTMQQSPVCDGALFAHHFERALREEWNNKT